MGRCINEPKFFVNPASGMLEGVWSTLGVSDANDSLRAEGGRAAVEASSIGVEPGLTRSTDVGFAVDVGSMFFSI